MTDAGTSFTARSHLTIRPLFSFPEEVVTIVTIWSFRNGKWVQMGLPQQFSWKDDKQMSVHHITLTNFSELASVQTGPVLLQIYNPNSGMTQTITFYASNKAGKKQAQQQIEKKDQKHSSTSFPFIDEEDEIKQPTNKKQKLEDEEYTTEQEVEEQLLHFPENFFDIQDFPVNIELEVPDIEAYFLSLATATPAILALYFILGCHNKKKKISAKKENPDFMELLMYNIMEA